MATSSPTPQQNLNALPPDVAASLAQARALARKNLDLTLAHLPEQMKQLPHWIVWAFAARQNKSGEWKITKEPYIAQVDAPRLAASNRPKEWRTLNVALTVLKQDWARKNGGFYDGLGFMFQGSGFSGIDLDHIIQADGVIAPWAKELLGELHDTYLERSVRGEGLHGILGSDFTGGGIKQDFSDGTGFELYCTGRYFVITGKPYNGSASVIAAYDVQSLHDRFKHGEIGPADFRAEQSAKAQKRLAAPKRVANVAAFINRYNIPINGTNAETTFTRYSITCPGCSAKDAYILQHHDGGVSMGCYHTSCAFSKERGDHWKEFSQRYPLKDEPKTRANDSREPKAEQGTREESDTRAGINWQDLLIVGKKGTPLACLANVITALTYADEWYQSLGFNEFTLKVVTQRKLPWERPVGSDWTDVDSSRTAAWLQQCTGILANSKTVTEAVQVVARNQSFHPVDDYLDEQEWDGIERLPTLFPKYFGATGDSILLAEIARMYFVSAVARIKQPGCQVDHLLVLQGLQGIYKSQGLRALFSSEWFTDQIPSLDSKDASLQLRGKWCIEFAEFDRLSRHETSTVKAYVTRTIDRFRPVFGTIPIDVKRECVFAATVNPEEFLVDDENRRFWTVHCEYVDVEGILRDRNQFWAEANARFKRGEHWHPEDAAIRRALLREQEQRKIENPYQERIRKWLELPATVNSIALDERWLTTSEILAGLEVPIAQWKSVEQHVSRGMRSLDYTKQRVGNRSSRFWVLKEEQKS